MSYAAAVDHLHGLTQELAALAAAAPPRKFDLDHMRVLAGALGDPQRQFRSILIAGTNGKGSTAATLAGILAAAGVRTALYTSPHLARVTERIRVSGPHASTDNCQLRTDNCSSEIPEEAFARLYFRVDETARQLVAAGRLPHHPSFFETLTALAFLHFAERNVEIAILEVGMGGRLDATNILDPLPPVAPFSRYPVPKPMRALILFAAMAACACGPASQTGVPEYGYDVVHVYPHDRTAFTEGLFYLDGFLYEATGLEGHS